MSETPPLADLCDLIIDCEHRTAPADSEGTYPLIRTPDIGLGFLKVDQAQRVTEETYRAWTKRAVPQPGDLILAREAPVGNVGIIPQGLQPVLGQRTVLIRCRADVLDSGYLNFLLSGSEMRGWMEGVSTGATVPHLNMADIRAMILPALPPINVQRKIAAILSAYDDLIKNNNRRIKVLEEMAQRLYREWFVDFRYPGHEGAQFVASDLGPIPERWKVLPVETMGHVVTGSTPPSSAPEWWGNEYAFVTPTDLSYETTWVAPERRLSALGAQKLASRALPTEAVCFTCIGATIGKMCMTQEPSITNQQINSIIPAKYHVNPDFLFHKLNSNVDMIRATASGAATPIISKSSFGAIRLVWPPIDLQNLFGRHARDYHALVSSLERENLVLSSSRNVLLPRLISGEIDVTDLDIQAPEAAA